MLVLVDENLNQAVAKHFLPPAPRPASMNRVHPAPAEAAQIASSSAARRGSVTFAKSVSEVSGRPSISGEGDIDAGAAPEHADSPLLESTRSLTHEPSDEEMARVREQRRMTETLADLKNPLHIPGVPENICLAVCYIEDAIEGRYAHQNGVNSLLKCAGCRTGRGCCTRNPDGCSIVSFSISTRRGRRYCMLPASSRA